MMKTRLQFFALSFSLMCVVQLHAQDSVRNINGKWQDTTSYSLLYQYQKKRLSTAAVSEIYSPDLQKTVSPSYGGTLTGRMAGLFTRQTSGEPGNDDVSVFLRGQTPMILVDGTPQSFPSINPEQIESITLLKDAVSTAMLGMRGGGGALLITTKKGSKQKQNIEFTALYGLQKPTQLPKFLHSYDYATLYNEALANDGRAPVYTQADLDAYKNGTDPIGHPDTDWQKQVLKDQASLSRYDLSISGGGATARYFVNLDYMHQDGLFKKADFNVYNTNADYKRYIFRSNVEVDLNKYITTSLNLFGRIQNTNQPGATNSTVFSSLLNTPNNASPMLNDDGSLGGRLDYQANPYAQILYTGYRPIYERDFKVDLAVKGNLDMVTKGLWVKALAAINAYQRETINRSKTFAVFQQSTDGTGAKVYSKYGVAGDQANSNGVNSQNRLFYTEFSAGYSKDITKDHHINALALFSNDYRMINTDLPMNFTTVAAKVSYDFQQKYLVDVAAGYNGTERYPQSKRYGLFPAVGLGWNITNENFMKDKAGWLNYLKLRASYGKTGNANVGYYDYYQYYVQGNDYGFGATVPSSSMTLMQGQLANPNITWEKANKFSVGVDATVLHNHLNITIDYFNDKYYDLVQERGNGSDILGTDYILENIGSNRYNGLELSFKWEDKVGAFSYFIAPNFTLIKSKVLYSAEPQRLYDYMRRTGRPVGQLFGYVAEGLFNSQQEITSHAFQGGSIVPGDIKYKDLNGDNVIDANDQQAIGNTKPQVYYGLNAGVSYKGFDLQVLFQGVTNNKLLLTGNYYFGFQNDGKGQAFEAQLGRWTPSNTTNATYPRLWTGTNANNTLTSSYWVRSANYIRLKNIELGYSLPASIAKRAKMTLSRIFISATNLLTFTSLDNVDPEGYAGGYPIMKTIQAGINIKF